MSQENNQIGSPHCGHAVNENDILKKILEKIGSMLYERTAISKEPEDVVRAELVYLRSASQLSPALVFKDPYHYDNREFVDHLRNRGKTDRNEAFGIWKDGWLTNR